MIRAKLLFKPTRGMTSTDLILEGMGRCDEACMFVSNIHCERNGETCFTVHVEPPQDPIDKEQAEEFVLSKFQDCDTLYAVVIENDTDFREETEFERQERIRQKRAAEKLVREREDLRATPRRIAEGCGNENDSRKQ